jgi:Protein of unknown function (DUF3800)
MSSIRIYLDESGDLGWMFDAPRGRGGSSRFLTIAAVVVVNGQEVQLERLVRGFYKARKRKLSSELKSHELSAKEKTQFLRQCEQLLERHPSIGFHAITVDKRFAPQALRTDNELLLNLMQKTLLVPLMAGHTDVTLIPDRTNGAERLSQILEGVLKIALIEGGAQTTLKIIPTDSRHDLGVQFADYLAGVVWQSYEFEDRDKQMGSLVCIKRSMLFKTALGFD